MRKSQYMTFILCVLLICLGCWYFLFPKPTDKDDLSITFKDTEKVKLDEKVDPVDLIRSTNSTKILYPTIDTSSPGVKKLLYRCGRGWRTKRVHEGDPGGGAETTCPSTQKG